VKPASLRRIRNYATRCLGLRSYLNRPGDGRPHPQIPATALLWSLLAARLLRLSSFRAVEVLVRCARRRRALAIGQSFGDDTLGYFTERLQPEPLRQALAEMVRRAKRNKAFDEHRFIGLAIDGTGAGSSGKTVCAGCRPVRNGDNEVVGGQHALVMISVVGTKLVLPLDAEPYGAGDSEYAAGQRILQRAVRKVGRRFADYVVVDAKFATAPFLNTAMTVGLPVVARLKENLPELAQAARRRFEKQSPTAVFHQQGDCVEVWDADDFDPWNGLQWETVRVLRYRQHKPNGEVVEAYWLTNFTPRRVKSQSLYRMAKSRWEIENQGFNEAKNLYGLEHICHHHPNSLLICWLLTFMTLTLERLYRIRYLHRGRHPVRKSKELWWLLWQSVFDLQANNTS
jgi:hypothetical protein